MHDTEGCFSGLKNPFDFKCNFSYKVHLISLILHENKVPV